MFDLMYNSIQKFMNKREKVGVIIDLNSRTLKLWHDSLILKYQTFLPKKVVPFIWLQSERD